MSWPSRRRNSPAGPGDAEEARRQLGVATTVLGDSAEQPDIRAVTHDLLGYLAGDLDRARAHHAAACQAAAEAGYVPMLAKVLVGVADLALRRGQDEQAARLLAASDGVRGLPDRSRPDEARIERKRAAASATRCSPRRLWRGRRTSWSELVKVTLAS